MRSKVFSFILLFSLIIAVPVSAFTSKELASFSDSPVAIAWAEGSTVYVAIANEARSRQNFTIEVYEGQRRSPVDRISTTIPARTVLIEEFSPGRGRYEIDEVVIYSASRTKRIVVQENELFDVRDYVVPANSNFKIGVDFYTIKGNSGQGRIVFDQNFRLSRSNRTGQISVSSFDSGYDSYPRGNVIEYRIPSLELSMWLPWMQGVDILSFGITHFSDWRGSRDFYYAPAIMVYGDDFRVIDGYTPESGDSGWVVR